MKVAFSRQILEIYSNSKFYEYPSSRSQVVSRRRTDEKRDTTNLTVAFCNFGKRLKTINDQTNFLNILTEAMFTIGHDGQIEVNLNRQWPE
jgi:hypothetical protein